MTQSIHLDGLRMNAVQTAANGVINADTVFEFCQSAERVWATYAGGPIDRGYLVGIVRGIEFEFRYCQLEKDGTLAGGHSNCELQMSHDSRVQIVEHFEWESRSGKGTNIIQELRESELPSN